MDELHRKAVDALTHMTTESRAWIPEKPGDLVVGTVRRITYIPSTYQADVQIPIISLRLADGRVTSVHGYDAVLRYALEELLEEGLARGWCLAVRYDGQRPKRSGKAAGKLMRVYTVVGYPPESGTGAGAADTGAGAADTGAGAADTGAGADAATDEAPIEPPF